MRSTTRFVLLATLFVFPLIACGDGDSPGRAASDPCLANACHPAATCTASGTTATCTCGDGYEGDGSYSADGCVDIDGCEADPCPMGVTCHDVPAPGTGHTCGTCPPGQEGDGTTCSEIDGCAGNPCFAGVACTDVQSPGTGYSCAACPAGYEGDGEGCSDLDECSPNPCFNRGACTDAVAPATGFTCAACPAGYEGDGVTCTDLNECTPNPCFGGGACTDAVAPATGFTCAACPAGYEGDGVTCSDLDECNPNPCFGGGACTDAVAPATGYSCAACPEGWLGDGESCDPIPRSCTDALDLGLSVGDGTYLIDVDGPGGHPPFDAWCDMTTNGGGWTMVLNYVHQGGTNPPVHVRQHDLPLMGSDTLGDDESGTEFWGHVDPDVLARFDTGEVRFYGRTSGHDRVMHFRTDDPGCRNYFASGNGGCGGIGTNFQPLTGHSTFLPAATNYWESGHGAGAMTNTPFAVPATYHWLISDYDRWEVDDYPGDASNHTIHRIFVRDRVHVPRSCGEIMQRGDSIGDGHYFIDPDGAYGLPPIQAWCDMTTDGGGWTMVLNYLHRGGTNPVRQPRGTDLPLMGSSALGLDGSGTPTWGHVSNAYFASFDVGEVRFYGETSAHSRVIHFKTSLPACIAYFASGTGSCINLASNFAALPGHTANLPAAMDTAYSNLGDAALVDAPFFTASAYHWAVNHAGRWEVDDYQPATPFGFDTLHRVFVREAATPMPRTCTAILEEDPSAPDGEYLIDPDGPYGNPPFSASCDMSTDGGGWTMILNYLHQGGTNPALSLRDVDLPLIGSDTLGTDESGSATWGHASSAMFLSLGPAEVRFYGRSSGHSRTIHFKTSNAACISTFHGVPVTCGDVTADFVPLTGHNSNIPASANRFPGSFGDSSLVWEPFAENAAHHWNVGFQHGRWEVDDYPNDASNDTLHRVFVRALTPLPRSCKEILDAGLSTGDGLYTIDYDGMKTRPPALVECDMTTDGGGWTLVANYPEGLGAPPVDWNTGVTVSTSFADRTERFKASDAVIRDLVTPSGGYRVDATASACLQGACTLAHTTYFPSTCLYDSTRQSPACNEAFADAALTQPTAATQNPEAPCSWHWGLVDGACSAAIVGVVTNHSTGGVVVCVGDVVDGNPHACDGRGGERAGIAIWVR